MYGIRFRQRNRSDSSPNQKREPNARHYWPLKLGDAGATRIAPSRTRPLAVAEIEDQSRLCMMAGQQPVHTTPAHASRSPTRTLRTASENWCDPLESAVTEHTEHGPDAVSPADLYRELRTNEIRVPGRTQGRTTSHTETWVAGRFLATIAATDLLHFPLRVEPGERPDLVLFPPTGRIGIELTEAISTDQARVDPIVA